MEIKEWASYLVCPLCKTPFRMEGNRLFCQRSECACVYEIREGIPILLIAQAQRPCPRCFTQREWKEEEETLICPSCRTIFKPNVGVEVS